MLECNCYVRWIITTQQKNTIFYLLGWQLFKELERAGKRWGKVELLRFGQECKMVLVVEHSMEGPQNNNKKIQSPYVIQQHTSWSIISRCCMYLCFYLSIHPSFLVACTMLRHRNLNVYTQMNWQRQSSTHTAIFIRLAVGRNPVICTKHRWTRRALC